LDALDQQALSVALGRLQRGDRGAADEVFRRAWPVVRAFAARWLAGSPQAEDVAQQALVKVFAQALAYDPTRDALGWILEVTVWECRTERARLRRSRVDPQVDATSTAGSAAGRPDSALEAAELSRALGEAIAGLGETDQRELHRLLADEASGDAAGRKRRQRAVDRLKALWRTLHGE
jgi:RNA polymerase sigma-70 factor, ECF subfamily